VLKSGSISPQFLNVAPGAPGSEPGLPDGIFSSQKYQFGEFLEGLKIENVGIFCAHLESIVAIWCVLRSFGNFVVILGHFSPFRYFAPRKI
jgi:hypothetical protein